MPYQDVERRRMLAAAVLGRDLRPPTPDLDGRDEGAGDESVEDGGAGSPGTGNDQVRLIAVSGQILDISPHLIIVEDDTGEERRLVIAPWATAWRGAPLPPADLPIGARVVIRALRSGTVAERIWADITRMTGIIRDVRGSRDLTIELDGGAHRRPLSVVVPYRFSGRIRVRHPQLTPGYLFDAIGVLDDGTALAHLPATSQPPYRGRSVPPPPAYGGTRSAISGTAVWADLDEHGVAYPMLEAADVGCDDVGGACAGLPYLALGSLLNVRNVCDGRSSTLPIVACGCVAGRFCDRCLECGTSPRGRLVELSPAAYVELGGDLTKGCFNARVGLG